MVRRSDVDRYARAADEVSNGAVNDLNRVLDKVAGMQPDAATDELLAVLPELVDYHGETLAAVAAQWYEQIRDAAGTYTATLGGRYPRQQVEGTVRYAAKFLNEGNQQAARNVLAGAMRRWVMYSGRETVARNVARDPSKPRFARVPVGETCAWCDMLASRGWVYHSAETAGINGGYHDHCNCQIVPSWESGRIHLEGYDPDDLHDKYEQALAELQAEGELSPNDAQIAQRLKDMYQYPDSPEVPSILREKAQGWPLDELPPVTAKAWRHILARHGRDGTAQTTFQGKSDYEIAKVIREVARSHTYKAGHAKDEQITNFYLEIDGEVVVVGVRNYGTSQAYVSTAFPVAQRGHIMDAWRART